MAHRHRWDHRPDRVPAFPALHPLGGLTRQRWLAGGLAALLLALSLFVPQSSWANTSVTLQGAKNDVSGTANPCTETWTDGGACYIGSSSTANVIHDGVPGTQVYVSVTIAAGSTSAFGWQIAGLCVTSNSTIAGSTSAVRTSNAAATYAWAFTLANNCPSFAVYVGAVSGTTTGTLNVASSSFLTYTKFAAETSGPGATAAPAPTSGPNPTTAPTAGPPPPPAPAGDVDPICWHGYRTDTTDSFGTYHDCVYRSSSFEVTGDPDDPGPLCSSAFLLPHGCAVDSYGWMDAVLGSGLVFELRELVALDATATAVSGGLSMGARDGEGDTPCGNVTMNFVIRFYTGTTAIAQHVITEALFFEHDSHCSVPFYSEDGSHGARVRVPEGADHVGFSVVCLTGCTFGSVASGDFNYIDAVALLQWYGEADEGNTVSTGGRCQDVGITLVEYQSLGCVGGIWGSTIDPNTGQYVCGPLSRDCGKPFFTPALLARCVAPASGLDAVGWLSYIACEVGNLPQVLFNDLLIPALNALIDLLYPGKLGLMWNDLQANLESRALFAWVGPVGDAWGGAWETVGTAPTGIGVVTYKGQSIDLSDPLSDAMDAMNDYYIREIVLAVVLLTIVGNFRVRVMSALNGGSSGKDAGT